MQKGQPYYVAVDFNKTPRNPVKLWQGGRDVPRSAGARDGLLNNRTRYRRWLTLSTRDAFFLRTSIRGPHDVLLIDLSSYEVQHAVGRVAVAGAWLAILPMVARGGLFEHVRNETRITNEMLLAFKP